MRKAVPRGRRRDPAQWLRGGSRDGRGLVDCGAHLPAVLRHPTRHGLSLGGAERRVQHVAVRLRCRRAEPADGCRLVAGQRRPRAAGAQIAFDAAADGSTVVASVLTEDTVGDFDAGTVYSTDSGATWQWGGVVADVGSTFPEGVLLEADGAVIVGSNQVEGPNGIVSARLHGPRAEPRLRARACRPAHAVRRTGRPAAGHRERGRRRGSSPGTSRASPTTRASCTRPASCGARPTAAGPGHGRRSSWPMPSTSSSRNWSSRRTGPGT